MLFTLSLAKSIAVARYIANVFAANVSCSCARDWVLCVDVVGASWDTYQSVVINGGVGAFLRCKFPIQWFSSPLLTAPPLACPTTIGAYQRMRNKPKDNDSQTMFTSRCD